MKREKDLEEKRKGEGLVDRTWAESKNPGGGNGRCKMHASEREELIALRAEKIRLQAQVKKNVEELRKCSRDHLHIVHKAEE